MEEAILNGVIVPHHTRRVSRRHANREKPKLWEARVSPAENDRWDTIVVRPVYLFIYLSNISTTSPPFPALTPHTPSAPPLSLSLRPVHAVAVASIPVVGIFTQICYSLCLHCPFRPASTERRQTRMWTRLRARVVVRVKGKRRPCPPRLSRSPHPAPGSLFTDAHGCETHFPVDAQLCPLRARAPFLPI